MDYKTTFKVLVIKHITFLVTIEVTNSLVQQLNYLANDGDETKYNSYAH
jgi:hypothetical protein